MAARAEQIGFQVAQEPLTWRAAERLQESQEGHPDAGPHERHAMALHVREIPLPDPGIARPGEVPAVGFRAEVVRAKREK
jgi:hypothetical protein